MRAMYSNSARLIGNSITVRCLYIIAELYQRGVLPLDTLLKTRSPMSTCISEICVFQPEKPMIRLLISLYLQNMKVYTNHNALHSAYKLKENKQYFGPRV